MLITGISYVFLAFVNFLIYKKRINAYQFVLKSNGYSFLITGIYLIISGIVALFANETISNILGFLYPLSIICCLIPMFINFNKVNKIEESKSVMDKLMEND